MTPKERIKVKKAAARERRLKLKESNKINNILISSIPREKKKNKKRKKGSIKGKNGILYDEELSDKMKRMNDKYVHKSWSVSGRPVKKVKDMTGVWVVSS